jgi:serine/threonine protein kinase
MDSMEAVESSYAMSVTHTWGDVGTHRSFNRDEKIPLQEGRLLGYGMNGPVYETIYNGIKVAWKRVIYRNRLTQGDRKEIDIIKRLRHRHVVEVVASYDSCATRPYLLGLLLWPVGVCDLGTFLDDIDSSLSVHENRFGDVTTLDDDVDETKSRFTAMGISEHGGGGLGSLFPISLKRLRGSLGCITSAIAYLHDNKIKHKDLKPSNIILLADGLRITDFGTASDFSNLTTSTTAGDERGTPKYMAPEVAARSGSSRAADIFSLGCIFLEIIALEIGYSRKDLRALIKDGDGSFQANLPTVHKWFDNVGSHMIGQRLLGVARHMIHPNPKDRPSATDVLLYLELIDGFRTSDVLTSHKLPLHGDCCSPRCSPGLPDPIWSTEELTLAISIGNTCHQLTVNSFEVTWFLKSSADQCIETVYAFEVSIHLRYHATRRTLRQGNLPLTTQEIYRLDFSKQTPDGSFLIFALIYSIALKINF